MALVPNPFAFSRWFFNASLEQPLEVFIVSSVSAPAWTPSTKLGLTLFGFLAQTHRSFDCFPLLFYKTRKGTKPNDGFFPMVLRRPALRHYTVGL